MANWFEFRGVRSTDLGVYVMEYPSFTIAQERVENKPVIGRSGSLTIREKDSSGDGVFEDVVLPFVCFVADLSAIDQISDWLKGDGSIVSGNVPNRYYKGGMSGQIDLRKIIRDDDHRLFTAVFRCRPFRYVYPEVNPTIVTNGGTIMRNPGNISSEPKYVITGTGDVNFTIGDKTIIIDGLDESITIDMELRLAYKTGSNPLLQRTSIVKLNDWPFTIPPTHEAIPISWTGNVALATVQPRWRYI